MYNLANIIKALNEHNTEHLKTHIKAAEETRLIPGTRDTSRTSGHFEEDYDLDSSGNPMSSGKAQRWVAGGEVYHETTPDRMEIIRTGEKVFWDSLRAAMEHDLDKSITDEQLVEKLAEEIVRSWTPEVAGQQGRKQAMLNTITATADVINKNNPSLCSYFYDQVEARISDSNFKKRIHDQSPDAALLKVHENAKTVKEMIDQLVKDGYAKIDPVTKKITFSARKDAPHLVNDMIYILACPYDKEIGNENKLKNRLGHMRGQSDDYTCCFDYAVLEQASSDQYKNQLTEMGIDDIRILGDRLNDRQWSILKTIDLTKNMIPTVQSRAVDIIRLIDWLSEKGYATVDKNTGDILFKIKGDDPHAVNDVITILSYPYATEIHSPSNLQESVLKKKYPDREVKCCFNYKVLEKVVDPQYKDKLLIDKVALQSDTIFDQTLEMMTHDRRLFVEHIMKEKQERGSVTEMRRSVHHAYRGLKDSMAAMTSSSSSSSVKKGTTPELFERWNSIAQTPGVPDQKTEEKKSTSMKLNK
ncbi:MAG: hypothetical protein ACHQAX_08200 [Gammaproteobacteria bacterium]